MAVPGFILLQVAAPTVESSLVFRLIDISLALSIAVWSITRNNKITEKRLEEKDKVIAYYKEQAKERTLKVDSLHQENKELLREVVVVADKLTTFLESKDEKTHIKLDQLQNLIANLKRN